MARRFRLRRTILMALTTLLAVTACGGPRTEAEMAGDARQQITIIVSDPQRREAVLAQLARWEVLLADKARGEKVFIARRDALNADYASTVADFQALQQQHAADSRRLYGDFITIRQAIIANTTEDEWQRLRAARDELRQAATIPESGAKP